MRISAAVAEGHDRPFRIVEVELDTPRPDEVLVKIVAVGLCHTDIAVKQGEILPPPAVLGHEGSGVVVAVGSDVAGIAAGDCVVLSFSSCGTCRNCSSGTPSYCTGPIANAFGGTRADGSPTIHIGGEPVAANFFGQSSFATHALVRARNVVKVADHLPLDHLGPLGCGIQTGAGTVLRALDCRPGAAIAILGSGAVGLSAVMAARLRGCDPIIVVEPHAARRSLALELGATHAIAPLDGGIGAAILSVAAGGIEYLIDTTGQVAVCSDAASAMAKKGVVALLGAAPPGTPVPGDYGMLLQRGVTIRGVAFGDSDPAVFIPELIAHYERGEFPFDRLLGFYSFRDINRAIEDQHLGRCVKAVLRMDA